MSDVARAITAGLFASLVFLALRYGITHPVSIPGGPLPASLLLAVAAYTGVFLALPPRRSLADRIRQMLVDDRLTPEEVADALTAAKDRIGALRTAGDRLPDDAQARVAALAEQADRIVVLVESDPGDLRRVGRFLRRDLTAAADIVDRYGRLDRAALEPDRALAVTRRFDAALDDLERLFRKHHARTYDNELFDLEVRLQLLEQQERGP